VLLGIGLNVRSAPEVGATPFVPATGVVPNVTLPGLLFALLESLALRYRELLRSGIGPLLSGYRAACRLHGRRVRVYPTDVDETAPPSRWPEPLAAGVVRGIRDDLALLIDGAPAVQSGRLAREESCQAFGLTGSEPSRPGGRFPR
jgi:biotin-(acetyl-CoA carboxylase) ligase